VLVGFLARWRFGQKQNLVQSVAKIGRSLPAHPEMSRNGQIMGDFSASRHMANGYQSDVETFARPPSF